MWLLIDPLSYLISQFLFNFADYIIIKGGRSCNRIATKEECEEAAQILGLSNTTAQVGSWNGPSHCHWWTGEPTLWFNTNFTADYDCTTEQQCICSARGGKSQGGASGLVANLLSGPFSVLFSVPFLMLLNRHPALF